ncbi:MAG: phytanoyl-CoA dioxygenase family protein [Vulcanimicrobiaceae bacterium]
MHFRDPKQRECFERQGYIVIDLLDEGEVVYLRQLWHDHTDPILAMPFNVTIMSDDLAYRERIHSEICGIVGPRQENLLRGSRFCYGSLVTKQPSHAGIVPLHQDPSFIDEREADTYNFWIALQDVNEMNGCLHVVPGSHRLNRHPRSNGAFFSFPYPEMHETIMRDGLVPVPARRGQAVITYQTLFHMSFPNLTPHPRLAVSALAVPQAASLRHYFQPFGAWEAPLEVFEVDDRFFIRHAMNERPTGVKGCGHIPYRASSITPETFSAALQTARHGI